jgi:hypothetical protein
MDNIDTTKIWLEKARNLLNSLDPSDDKKSMNSLIRDSVKSMCKDLEKQLEEMK